MSLLVWMLILVFDIVINSLLVCLEMLIEIILLFGVWWIVFLIKFVSICFNLVMLVVIVKLYILGIILSLMLVEWVVNFSFVI